jgi:transmembrane sensor
VTAAPERLPEAIVRTAIEWQMRLRASPGNVEVFSQFNAWRLRDTRHDLAWQRMQLVSGHFHNGHLPDATCTAAVLRQADVDLSRRRTLKLLGLGLTAGGATLLIGTAPPAWRSDFTTGVGEQRQLRLNGDLELQLNTDSAVDLHGREIRLRSGEMLVDGADWRVRCQQGVCQGHQARAVLRERDGYSELHVERGEVLVTAAAGSQRVQAGSGLALYPTRLAPLGGGALDPFAWSRGLLIVNDIPLADFLAEAARYRRGWLRCDPAVADLRLSGVFHLDQPGALLDNIAHLLPVRIDQRTRWWVRISSQA